ncbi:MAG: 3-isopropylmalate dehydratase small subunit [Chloroflexi bacterium]|nr:3-isopropylmalate dehydratase small subunit [Chloroflexota bacterium]
MNMPGTPVTTVRGRGIVLRGNNVDTDQIIPARYLRMVTFDGLGRHVFEDERKAAGGAHPFDDERFAGSRILFVNDNFGSGSSREHAPQALARWGIEAIVGESFAEIFFGNSTTLGLPLVTLPAKEAAELQALVETDPGLEFDLDVSGLRLTAGEREYPVSLPAPTREALLSGRWDALGELRQNMDSVRQVHGRLPYVSGFAG